MAKQQRKIYNEAIKHEKMSENAFLMAWNDYFNYSTKAVLTQESESDFIRWLTKK